MKTPRAFGKMDLKSSFQGLRVLFTCIKCNFFQKVAFYTNQMDFLGWLFSKRAFWAEKVETDEKVAFCTNQMDFLGWLFSKRAFWAEKVETDEH